MAPAVLVYLLATAERRGERLALLAVFGVPPLVFFLWSPEHLKILAYVPGPSWWHALGDSGPDCRL
jgi:hypothetical protein